MARSGRLRRPVADRNDLSVPRGAPVRGSLYDADAFGRFSEGLARLLGTGKYLAAQTIFVIAWIILNVVAGIHHWDAYPFILLNLAFSTQAAYAAPLILLAQNRQDERDRGSIEFLARELAAVRLALNDLVTNDDLTDQMERLAKLLADRPADKPVESQ